MRILHVVPSYLPAVRYGGPIFTVHGLCRALAAKGHELQVFTTNIDGPGITATPIATPVDLDGIQIRYFPCPLVRRLYWAPALGRALHLELGKLDVVHLHSVFLWPTWAAARAARKARVPYVLSPSLTVSQIWVSVASSAAWATRERRCQSGHQSPSHRCNRVRNVAFRPQRRILWAGNLRVRQIAGRAWWHDLLRGESSLARRSGIRMPQCKGWRDGGSRATPVLQNVPARPPA